MYRNYKVFDSHTHLFPDNIAAKAIASLETHDGMNATTDGTADGLLASMQSAGVDMSLVLPVVTNPRQFEHINLFAAEINRRASLMSFGGIHPDCEEPEKKLDYILSLGLRGVKLHPDYQGCYIDDPRYIRIIGECLRRGLFVVIHTGFDPLEPVDFHCNAKRCAAMLDRVDGLNTGEPRIILAHLGSNLRLRESLGYLAGRNVLFDTAYVLSHCDADEMTPLIRAHGAERVLFASDCPWSSQKDDIKALLSLPLSDEDKQNILWNNAARVFGL